MITTPDDINKMNEEFWSNRNAGVTASPGLTVFNNGSNAGMMSFSHNPRLMSSATYSNKISGLTIAPPPYHTYTASISPLALLPPPPNPPDNGKNSFDTYTKMLDPPGPKKDKDGCYTLEDSQKIMEEHKKW